MPKTQRPEEDRDDVLAPTVDRRHTARSRRQMGSRRVKEDADQDVDRDEEAPFAKKCLQKVHFSSYPLVDACELGRSRFQRSSHSAGLVLSRHTPAAGLVAPLLAAQTCHG